MVKLTIEGRTVTVDDGFLDMSPAEQEATVDEIASGLGVSASAEPKRSGAGMNFTAGINEGIYGTLGAPVDLARGAINLGIRGVNKATGADIGTIPEDSVGGSRWIAEQAGAAHPVLDPQNTEANTTGERIARGAGQGVGYSIAPEAVVAGASRAAVLPERVVETGRQIFGPGASAGQVATNAAVGGASGAGATAAMEAAPDELDPLAGVVGGLTAGGIAAGTAVAGPRLFNAGRRVASDAVAPLSQGGRERMAAERLRDGATDVDALRQSLDGGPQEIIPGSKPTTFQQSGDMGVGAMERGAAARRPDLFNQRRAEQNAARVGAVSDIQAKGAPEAVATAVRQRIQEIEDAAARLVDDATSAARGKADQVGRGMSPDAAGDTMRAALETARTQAKQAERALWNAVDPDGTLALSAKATKSQAAQIIDSMPAAAKRPSGEEAAIYGVLDEAGDVMPFSEMTALQSRLKAEMRAERFANGETPAYARMSRLNSAIQQDLETAVVGKVQQEAQAVARGAMTEEQTAAFRISQWQNDWRQRQAEARALDAGGIGQNAGGRTTAVSGARGTAGQAGVGSGNPPGNPRLSADAPNFDEASLGRLNEARAATKQRAETFDNKTLGPIRRRPGTTSPYDMPAGAVPQRIFRQGPRGFEAVQTYRNAVGDDEALQALQGYAVDRLRKAALREDGTLDPAKVKAWRRSYSDALRAFPELDKRFADAASASEAMAEVTREATRSVRESQRGILGRVMGLEDPQDVTRAVGSIFSAQDSATRMLKLRNAIGKSADAKTGLRKAVVDHITERFVGNTEAGTSGIGTMKSDGFQTFVRKNRAALRTAGFSDDEVKLMQRVADDLQRANRSIASVKNPGGSNTAQDTLQVQRDDTGSTLLAKVIAKTWGPGAGGVGGFLVGGYPGMAAGVGAGVLAELRKQGLETVQDIVADALLNPERARVLLRSVKTPKQEEAAVKALGRLFRKSAVPTAAVSATSSPLPEEERRPDARLTPADRASPMPPDLIGQGKAMIEDATAR